MAKELNKISHMMSAAVCYGACVCVRQNLILPSETCSWINIFVDPGTTLLSTNKIYKR